MKTSTSMTVVASSLLWCSVLNPARADLTISMRTTYSGPLVDEMRKKGNEIFLSHMSTMQLYMTPKCYRIDTDGNIDIMNFETRKVVTLNGATHTYTEESFDPSQPEDFQRRLAGSTNVFSNVVCTDMSAMYLGHRVKRYTADVITTITGLPANMRTSKASMDMLVAQDLTQANMDMLAKYDYIFGLPPGIKGLALQTQSTCKADKTDWTNGFVSTINATVLSNKTIDPSVFEIPSGFSKAEPKDPATKD